MIDLLSATIIAKWGSNLWKTPRNIIVKNVRKKIKRKSVTAIPTWSPTAVLSDLVPAWLRSSEWVPALYGRYDRFQDEGAKALAAAYIEADYALPLEQPNLSCCKSSIHK